MKIGDRVFVRGYIDEIRKDTVIIHNDGGYFGTIPSEVIAGELPSAQPERKRGKWIRDKKPYADGKRTFEFVQLRCSECGALRRIGWHNAKFCPNCGVKMKGEDE